MNFIKLKAIYVGKSILILLIISTFFACNKKPDDKPKPPDNDPASIDNPFSVDKNYIHLNNKKTEVKEVVYVPAYPGNLPWDIENAPTLSAELEGSIRTDIANIKAMGANTIRFWGAPEYCYEVIKNIGGLYILQTIWFDGEQPDFQNNTYKNQTKNYIRTIIDRIYSAYNNENPPILAFLVGNELSEQSIKSTDAAHPEINKFTGNFIKTETGITATEAFIAEMADYLKTYEKEKYGRVSLVSYSNDIRTAYLIDTPFLDFRSHNAYSYAVPYYRPNTQHGSSTGTLFQGWLEELKAKHPEVPLLITETGLSVSPNAAHIGPPNYGYGGNTISEQATGIIQNIYDLKNTNLPIAGVCIHEYLDAWWKFSLEDSYTHDPDDIEEWFGIVSIVESAEWYHTQPRPVYEELKKIWYY